MGGVYMISESAFFLWTKTGWVENVFGVDMAEISRSS